MNSIKRAWDFICDHSHTAVGLVGTAATAATKWLAAQAWIQNAVGLFTIAWFSCLIFGWFKRKGWNGKVAND
jgi:hypothetical protein